MQCFLFYYSFMYLSYRCFVKLLIDFFNADSHSFSTSCQLFYVSLFNSICIFQVKDLSDAIVRLKHAGFDPWRRLSHYHWLAILSLYNISLSGHYLSILPPIRLSHLVSADEAHQLRNPDEKAAHFQWQALAVALDPLDFSGTCQ